MSAKHGSKAGEPEVTKENTIREKREFNPDLKPGEESNARRTNWRKHNNASNN